MYNTVVCSRLHNFGAISLLGGEIGGEIFSEACCYRMAWLAVSRMEELVETEVLGMRKEDLRVKVGETWEEMQRWQLRQMALLDEQISIQNKISKVLKKQNKETKRLRKEKERQQNSENEVLKKEDEMEEDGLGMEESMDEESSADEEDNAEEGTVLMTRIS